MQRDKLFVSYHMVCTIRVYNLHGNIILIVMKWFIVHGVIPRSFDAASFGLKLVYTSLYFFALFKCHGGRFNSTRYQITSMNRLISREHILSKPVNRFQHMPHGSLKDPV